MSGSLTLILLIVVSLLILSSSIGLFAMRRRAIRLEKGHYFESSQGPIHYYIQGKKGPAVLFIHGLGASAFCWRHVTGELKHHFQCIRVDLWGFGFSTKKNHLDMSLDTQIQILQELMDELGFTEYHVVGHSMGGQIALWLDHHDHRVKKCVAIAPAAHPDLVSVMITKNRWIANWTPIVMSPRLIHYMVKRLLIHPEKMSDEIVEGYFQPYLDPETHLSFASALNMIRDRRVYENLKQMNGDILVLWGEKDRVIHPTIQKKITELLVHAKHITRPRSGHLPMEDHPDQVVQDILPFLKS